MKKIINILSRNVDKLLHFLVTYSITISLTVYGYWIGGIILSLILSIMKEIFDQYLYKGFSWGDILADLIGIISAIIVCIGVIL